MYPAFRSIRSMLSFCTLLLVLIGLPVILHVIGLPPRVEAWSGVSNHAGAVGDVVHTIYDDSHDADVLFVGPSLIRRGVMLKPIEQALSAHLGRPAHVAMLSMVWAGADMPYFMLRDYLARHKPQLIVWEVPGPTSNSNEPHIQAYRWMRFGEYSDAFAGLPLFSRVQVYAEMILGAPKELLYKLRPNIVTDEEKTDQDGEDVRENINTGYHKAKFVPEPLPSSQPTAKLIPDTSPIFHIDGDRPEAYQLNFVHKIAALAADKGVHLVFLHIPTDLEYGNSRLPEIANWSAVLGSQYNVIAIPAAELFQGSSRDHFLHYYSDSHLNTNGRRLFTNAIIPPVLEAYDQSK